MAQIHCVCIHRPMPDDKRQKATVERALVLADNPDDAMRKVAAYARENHYGLARITYRNSWEPAEIFPWDFYTEERRDYPHDAPTALSLL